MWTSMYKFSLSCLLGALIAISTACGKVQTQVDNLIVPAESKERPTPSTSWNEVPLPFEAETLVLAGDRVIVVGSEGIGIVNENRTFERLPALELKRRYRIDTSNASKQATVALKEVKLNSDLSSRLCTAKTGEVVSSKLVVYALCDHGDQLWIVPFTNSSKELNVIDFPQADVTSSMSFVIGPAMLAASSRRILIPAYAEKTPMLLSSSQKTDLLEIVWKGNPGDGAIIAIDFVGEEGWMSLINGELMYSSDGGVKWSRISTIPSNLFDTGGNLKFVTSRKGYFVGNRSIASTVDGGKTWHSESLNLDDSFYETQYKGGITITWGAKGLYYQRSDDSEWHVLEPKFESAISGMLVNQNKVFILNTGKLYFMEF